MRVFKPPRWLSPVKATIQINAAPNKIMRNYADAKTWGKMFPDTILSAEVVASGDNWTRIEVKHKKSGNVVNVLVPVGRNAIGLVEQKPLYRAWFLSEFLPNNGGTAYTLSGWIRLKGPLIIIEPFLRPYIKKQMYKYSLMPVKRFIEQ